MLLERTRVSSSSSGHRRSMLLVELVRESRKCLRLGGFAIGDCLAQCIELACAFGELRGQRSNLSRLICDLLVAHRQSGVVRLLELLTQRRKRRRLAVVEFTLKRVYRRRLGALENLGALGHFGIVLSVQFIAQLVQCSCLVFFVLLVACRKVCSVLLLE